MTADAILFDVSAGGRLTISGEDRRRFLHNFCTNDISGLADGETREAFVTDRTGHVLGHVWVAARPDALDLHAVASPLADVLEHLRRYVITEDVQIEDVTETSRRVLLSGPEAAEAAAAIAATLPDNVVSADVDWLGPGDVLLTAPAGADEVLPLAGVAAGLVPGTLEEFETRRIAARLPVHGRDITSAHLAQEVDRNDLAISLTKGCYLGQETIARVASRGHVNRLLCGLAFDDGPLPEAGAAVLGDDGQQLGTVSSVAPVGSGPFGESAVALAMLRHEASEVSEASETPPRVVVETAAGKVPAVVVGPRG